MSEEKESIPQPLSTATDVVTYSARARLTRRISELGEWFHNLNLHGVPTAPDHFLGDFPSVKWRQISNAIPPDLTGASVLDRGFDGGCSWVRM